MRNFQDTFETRNVFLKQNTSSFVSVRTRISILFVMRSFNWSDLLGKEFILKWPTMTLFGLLNLNLLSLHCMSSL